MTVPPGTYGRIAPRSGLALKNHIDISTGVIDRDYTGPVGILMVNNGLQDFKVNSGDRIAQLILEQIADEPIIVTQELTDTARGDGGFGSTGAKQINIILGKQENNTNYSSPSQDKCHAPDIFRLSFFTLSSCYLSSSSFFKTSFKILRHKTRQTNELDCSPNTGYRYKTTETTAYLLLFPSKSHTSLQSTPMVPPSSSDNQWTVLRALISPSTSLNSSLRRR